MVQPNIYVVDDEPIARITVHAILKAHDFDLYFAENGAFVTPKLFY